MDGAQCPVGTIDTLVSSALQSSWNGIAGWIAMADSTDSRCIGVVNRMLAGARRSMFVEIADAERGLRQRDDVIDRRRVGERRPRERDRTERHDRPETDRDPTAHEPGSTESHRRVHAEQHGDGQDRDEQLPQYRTWLLGRGGDGSGGLRMVARITLGRVRRSG